MDAEINFNLSKANVVIIGLGLMGGSLALALRGKCAALFGVDPDSSIRELALRQKIVDFANDDPAVFLSDADLVILAAPVPAILASLEQLKDLTPNPCIVIDLGSTKVQIVEKMAALPDRFDPIGGHPICGKEKLSLENAERTLFYSAPFLFTPLHRTTLNARAACEQIVSAIGAKDYYLGAEEHDRILASTSHLPFLLSSALVMATPQDVTPYVGPGFRSASRLAGTSASMMLGVILTNRENLLSALERIQDELSFLTSAIAENDAEALMTSLSAAHESYLKLTSGNLHG